MDRGKGGAEHDERLEERLKESGKKWRGRAEGGWCRWKQTGHTESVTYAGDKTA